LTLAPHNAIYGLSASHSSAQMMGHLQHLMRSAIERACPVFHNPDDKRRKLSCDDHISVASARGALAAAALVPSGSCSAPSNNRRSYGAPSALDAPSSPHLVCAAAGLRYCFQTLNASAKTRSPGVPFSSARMARRLLLYTTGIS